MNAVSTGTRRWSLVTALVVLIVAAFAWTTRYETLAVRTFSGGGQVVERNRYTGELRMINWYGKTLGYIATTEPVQPGS